MHHVGKRAVRTFQPVHAGKAFVGDDGDIGPSRRFIARTRHRKPYASHFGGGREPMISRPMGRRTETSMAPSSRRQRLAALVADRVIDAVLALPSLSTSLGATAGRGSGAHNICAGHGSCARLLAAGGPKLGEGRRPDLGIGAQDKRLAADLHGAQSSCTYLLIRLLAAKTIGITEVFERQSGSVHFQFTLCLWCAK